MADSEAVLKELDPPDDVEIIGIVVNQKGAERAIATEAVQTLGFPYSVSPTFLERNQHQTLEAAADELEQIKLKADAAGLNVVAYISMAFGNPYGDLWNAEEVIEAVGILADMNITQISLGRYGRPFDAGAGEGTDCRRDRGLRLSGDRRAPAQHESGRGRKGHSSI